MTKQSKSLTSAEVILLTMPPRGHVEVRERQDKTFRVFYSDEGFIPCAPVCKLSLVQKSHMHEYEQKMIESFYHPTSFEDAMDWAEKMAIGREVKIIMYADRAKLAKAARKEKANREKFPTARSGSIDTDRVTTESTWDDAKAEKMGKK